MSVLRPDVPTAGLNGPENMRFQHIKAPIFAMVKTVATPFKHAFSLYPFLHVCSVSDHRISTQCSSQTFPSYNGQRQVFWVGQKNGNFLHTPQADTHGGYCSLEEAAHGPQGLLCTSLLKHPCVLHIPLHVLCSSSAGQIGSAACSFEGTSGLVIVGGCPGKTQTSRSPYYYCRC